MEALNAQKLIKRLYQIRKERNQDASIDIIKNNDFFFNISSLLTMSYEEFESLIDYNVYKWTSTSDHIVIIAK